MKLKLSHGTSSVLYLVVFTSHLLNMASARHTAATLASPPAPHPLVARSRAHHYHQRQTGSHVWNGRPRRPETSLWNTIDIRILQLCNTMHWHCLVEEQVVAKVLVHLDTSEALYASHVLPSHLWSKLLYTMLYYVILCYTMLYYVILCYTMLYYVILCYYIVSAGWRIHPFAPKTSKRKKQVYSHVSFSLFFESLLSFSVFLICLLTWNDFCTKIIYLAHARHAKNGAETRVKPACILGVFTGGNAQNLYPPHQIVQVAMKYTDLGLWLMSSGFAQDEVLQMLPGILSWTLVLQKNWFNNCYNSNHLGW